MYTISYKLALALACVLQAAAAPIPEAAGLARRQGAGVGAACNSIFSDTDTMIGDLTQSEGEHISSQIKGGSRLVRRQGAGVGAGCNSLFSDSDTFVGDLTQSEGESIANQIKGGSSTGTTGSGSGAAPAPAKPAPAPAKPAPAAPKGPKAKRQANGIGYGVADVLKAAGAGQAADSLGSQINTLDGETTDGSAQLGASVGQSELSVGQSIETLTGAQDSYSRGGAHSSKKRQANGIGYGIADIMKAAGAGGAADTFGSRINTIDGQTTDGSAQLGKAVGESELSIGQSLETTTGAEDSYHNGGAHSS